MNTIDNFNIKNLNYPGDTKSQMQHLPEEWGRPRRDHLLPSASASSHAINRTQ